MSRLLKVSLFAAVLLAVPSIALALGIYRQASASVCEPVRKQTICHATGSDRNPYVVITIAVEAIFKQGHDQHSPGGRPDVIPPFCYLAKDGTFVSYAGRTWNAWGQAVFGNGCKLVEPTRTPKANHTPTATKTTTATDAPSPTPSTTDAPSATPTATVTQDAPSATPTLTATQDAPSATPTPTATWDAPSATPTPTATWDAPSATPTPTATWDAPSATPTPTATSDAPSATPTPTDRPGDDSGKFCFCTMGATWAELWFQQAGSSDWEYAGKDEGVGVRAQPRPNPNDPGDVQLVACIETGKLEAGYFRVRLGRDDKAINQWEFPWPGRGWGEHIDIGIISWSCPRPDVDVTPTPILPPPLFLPVTGGVWLPIPVQGYPTPVQNAYCPSGGLWSGF